MVMVLRNLSSSLCISKSPELYDPEGLYPLTIRLIC